MRRVAWLGLGAALIWAPLARAAGADDKAAAQAMFDFRVKKGVKSTATMVPMSQSSAVNGRSPTPPPVQPGINGFSMVLTQSGNSDM